MADLVWCPILEKEIEIGLCREVRMTENSEFIPGILEDELIPDRDKQCQICPYHMT
ncbi:MAG: hypothetical protein KBA30_06295 [Clostridia bacterium]|nr:hypothetical protein [Clostridia bacterium]